MRKIALLLMIWPLLAVAQDETNTFTDEGSGLVVKVPEGWDREARREQGSIRFSAKLDLARSQYVSFEVVAVRARWETDAWVADYKAKLPGAFKDPTTPFTVDQGFKVGGKSAVLITIGGKRTSSQGTEYDQRIRYAAVQNGDIFLEIQEISVNGAHEEDPALLQKMWDAVSFQTPEGDLGGGGTGLEGGDDDGGSNGGDGTKAANAESTPVDDKSGNFKLTLPPGWVVVFPPPEEENNQLRLVAQRLNDRGDGIGALQVERFTSPRASDFTQNTPANFLTQVIDRQFKKLEQHYGENTAGTRRPTVNEGILLGGAAKSGEFVYRGITNEEEDKIRELEDLKRRGEKVEIPEYKDIVVRGRLALISPHIYFVKVVFNRAIADDENMLAEYQAIMDSWEFHSKEALPPPLVIGGRIGDTRETRKEAKAGKKVLNLSGSRPYRVEIEYELPPGFAVFEGQTSENVSLVVYAQDDQNNWVTIEMAHWCASRLSEQRKKFGPRDQHYETWKSNFESKARGVKVPRREQSVNLRIRGLGSGKGYKKLEGDVEGHRGTFTGYLRDKSGWRHEIRIETRGDGDKVWEDGIEDFFKSLRIKTEK